MTMLNPTSKRSILSARLALTCAVSALAACGQGGATSNTTSAASNADADNTLADAPPPSTALPLATGPAPAYRAAPVASALPPAPTAPIGRVPQGEQYAYLNQAYDFSQSLAGSPPDYSYDYQGEQPWVWQSPDGYYRVAERLPSGVRYFYYAPGASTPYLVQDPHYSYAYSRGYLAAIYGPGGQALPPDVEARQARQAGAYLAWAAGLYAAARHEQHVAVSQERWNAERQDVYADQARWNADQQRNAEWAAYSQAHQNDQAHWAAQRYVRAAEAARFAQAVNDQTALARAQQAAVDARAIAQSRGERLPGPQPAGAVADRERQGPAPAVSGPERSFPAPTAPVAAGADRPGPGPQIRRPANPEPAGAFAAQHPQGFERQGQTPEPSHPPIQARDQVAAQAAASAAAQRQAERQSAAQGAALARAEHEAQVAGRRQAEAQAHAAAAQAHQDAGRPVQANEAAQRAAADRAEADAHRQAAVQAAEQARQHAAQAAEAHAAAEAQAHKQAPPPAAPHAVAPPPAKPKPKPDEPHP